ncbi:hypothetical protein ABID56_001535 [Alkalibacillus flavidus]|uniref:Uncharacterized protein n=1 Tax=Alkalibacillus flavidus TaxID=546021 RepID=A0ABV2KY20_9BACI
MQKRLVLFYCLVALCFLSVILFTGNPLNKTNQTFTANISIADLTINDKFTENNQYYIDLTFENEFYVSRYNIENNKRVYRLSNKEIYEKIDLDSNDNYGGMTLKVMIHPNDINKEELQNIQQEPQLIFSKKKYSKYVEVIDILSKG